MPHALRPAFVGLGSNSGDPTARLASALRRLTDAGERVAAVAAPRWGPFEVEPGRWDDRAPAVLNTVAELRTERTPHALLDLLLRIEGEEGRSRAGDGSSRRLDLDLLALGAPRDESDLVLPHPRAVHRAFVLAPWEDVAPLVVVPGTGRRVVEHAAALRARRPEAFRTLRQAEPLELPTLPAAPLVLDTTEALRDWREARSGVVGVVPTMGALHAGHAALLRRARAECDAVVATIFVNPLQFGPSEDLGRYPRTFDEDMELLSRCGADAVYVPTHEDLYAADHSTYVLPEGPALGLEGALRAGHFRGVATVVLKLWLRTRPTRGYFGQKDAQQLAVIRRMVRDLDLDGEIVACPTVHERDGLALSSRNRYLSASERERALGLPRALEAMAFAAAAGRASAAAEGRAHLEAAGLDVDYLEIVDPDTMTTTPDVEGVTLAVGAVRVGATRLLDNRWLAATPEDRA